MKDADFESLHGVYVTNFLQRAELWAAVLSHAEKTPAALAAAESYARAVLVPVCGKAVQRPGTVGFDPDGFMGQEGTFCVFTRDAVRAVVVSGWLPSQHAETVTMHLSCAGTTSAVDVHPGAAFRCTVAITLPPQSEAECHIRLSASFQPSSIDAASKDTRHLGCLIDAVEFL